jgi:hypothetical protein
MHAPRESIVAEGTGGVTRLDLHWYRLACEVVMRDMATYATISFGARIPRKG